MPRNIEIKARIENVRNTIDLAKKLSIEGGGDGKDEILHQHDIFYNNSSGERLKLRIMGNGGQLIQYERDDKKGPKLSNFSICKVDDPIFLNEVLTKNLGIRTEVIKLRTLIMIGQTRIHVDEVFGRGNFIEFEVVLRDDQSVLDGEKIAKDLMQKFNIKESDLVECAYADL